jgi:hypothetical protein
MDELKRTILYYPYISVPGDWLKKSLLYWDEIGSIIPRHYVGRSITPEMEFLKREEIFRHFEPSDLMSSPMEITREFHNEFKSVVNSSRFNKIIRGSYLRRRNHKQRRHSRNDEAIPSNFLRANATPIHFDKISHGLLNFLDKRNLAIPQPNRELMSEYSDNPGDWFLMEKNTAGLYMSLLAKYLAEIDTNATVPGTDSEDYHRLNFDSKDNQDAFYCYSTTLHDLLPAPRDTVSIEDLLEYKNRRIDELYLLRFEISEFQKNLSNAESPAHIKEITISFAERMRREVNIIKQTMQETGIESQLGTLQTFVKMGVPTLLTGMTGPILSNLGIMQVPVELSVAAAATVGLINVSTHMVGRRNQRRVYLRDAPFSYLYYGQSEGII